MVLARSGPTAACLARGEETTETTVPDKRATTVTTATGDTTATTAAGPAKSVLANPQGYPADPAATPEPAGR